MEFNSTPQAWQDRVGGFATSVGKSPEEITAALITLTGEPSDDAVSILADSAAVSDSDLKDLFVVGDLKIPSGVFNKHVSKLRGPQPVLIEERAVAGPSFDILPSVPEDSSFLESLKVGGVLKVGSTEVLSAVKAGIANRLHIFDLPDIIKKKMEAFAEEQDEPVGKDYFDLQKLVASRSYAEVLSVLGVEGNFMSPARQNKFLQKLDENLWGALRGFQTQLAAWQETWMAGMNSPAAMSMMMMGQLGKTGVPLPTGMLQPPETSGLHDEAEAVINSINKTFAGLGIPVARALAYDATRIKGVLENPALPGALGYATREIMLKGLGITVGADYVRLERNITRYTLAIMEFPKVTVPNEEYAYLGALIQLGATIPWDKLEGGGIGTKARL